MFRLEERRAGAEIDLALALLRAWMDFARKPSCCEERDWLKKISPICMQMIESALRRGGPEHPCTPGSLNSQASFGFPSRRIVGDAHADYTGISIERFRAMRPELIRATELLRLNTPEGVEEAIGLLQNTVYSFSMKVCGHPEDAEDTMQEVLSRSLGHLAKIENPQQLAVWLYTVTRNRCWRMRRKPAHAPARHALAR